MTFIENVLYYQRINNKLSLILCCFCYNSIFLIYFNHTMNSFDKKLNKLNYLYPSKDWIYTKLSLIIEELNSKLELKIEEEGSFFAIAIAFQ